MDESKTQYPVKPDDAYTLRGSGPVPNTSIVAEKTSLFNYREAKSNVAEGVLDQSVLIKAEYEAVFSQILNMKSPVDTEAVYSIAGYGADTKGFDIGDIILFEHEYVAQNKIQIRVEENNDSFEDWHNHIKQLAQHHIDVIRNRGTKYRIVEYVIIPSYAIRGVVTKDTLAWQNRYDIVFGGVKKITEKQARAKFNV
jgi:hypothetical protein